MNKILSSALFTVALTFAVAVQAEETKAPAATGDEVAAAPVAPAEDADKKSN